MEYVNQEPVKVVTPRRNNFPAAVDISMTLNW
jgi:hypothetical protein